MCRDDSSINAHTRRDEEGGIIVVITLLFTHGPSSSQPDACVDDEPDWRFILDLSFCMIGTSKG
jgi:hypothetical protein